MRVGIIQINADSNKAANIVRACSLVAKAAKNGAEFILLPEVFNYRGSLSGVDLFNEIAEDIPGESLYPLMKIAKEEKVNILAGSIYERNEEGSKVYNTSVLIDEAGNISGKYRKINLFRAEIEGKSIDESRTYEAGTEPIMCLVKGKKVGLSICFDLRFPELFREYYKQHVDMIVLPSSFSQKTGEKHWQPLLQARAIENYCYVLAPNQFGPDGNGVETYGHSMVIDHQGQVQAVLETKQDDILITDIEFQPRSYYPTIQS
jgi:deaminated glutathione amidase